MKRDQSETLKLKPFWKSVSFWMGGLVAVFLCWAWVDSKQTRSWLSWHSYQLSSENGSLYVAYDKLRLFGSNVSFSREPAVPLLSDLPMIGRLFHTQPRRHWVFWTGNDRSDVWLQAGAHWWFITLLWVVVWRISFTLYRRWQLKKVAASGL